MSLTCSSKDCADTHQSSWGIPAGIYLLSGVIGLIGLAWLPAFFGCCLLLASIAIEFVGSLIGLMVDGLSDFARRIQWVVGSAVAYAITARAITFAPNFTVLAFVYLILIQALARDEYKWNGRLIVTTVALAWCAGNGFA